MTKFLWIRKYSKLIESSLKPQQNHQNHRNHRYHQIIHQIQYYSEKCHKTLAFDVNRNCYVLSSHSDKFHFPWFCDVSQKRKKTAETNVHACLILADFRWTREVNMGCWLWNIIAQSLSYTIAWGSRISIVEASCHSQESTRQIDWKGMTGWNYVFEDTGIFEESTHAHEYLRSQAPVFVFRRYSCSLSPLSSGLHHCLWEFFIFHFQKDESVMV